MKNCQLKIFGLLMSVLLVYGCIEPYSPDGTDSSPDHLVVDGFIDVVSKSAKIKLSRAVALSEESPAPLENDALVQVTIEDDQGNSYPLTRVATGEFHIDFIPVDIQRTYRLSIKVSANEEYASDFVEIKETPPIEEVFFDIRGSELRILVNTSDPSGRTKYLRYIYDETFEHTSAHYSTYMLQSNRPVVRPTSEQIYRCYRTQSSSGIILASSTELDADAIRNFHVRSIHAASQMLQVRYSINLKQIALTEAAYKYWYGLYQTTQNVGGLFDPMPGEITGNVKSIRNDGRKAIGFFSAASIKEKRIFITPDMLPDGFGRFRHPTCPLDTILNEDLPATSPSTLLVNGISEPMGTGLIGYTTSANYCIDCRALFGGDTEKPPFWP